MVRLDELSCDSGQPARDPAVEIKAPARPSTPDTFSSADLKPSSDGTTHAEILSRCTIKTGDYRAIYVNPSKWPEPFKECYRSEMKLAP
jgi:hypothetical protein